MSNIKINDNRMSGKWHLLDDITVVIRQIGERSFCKFRENIFDYIPENRVIVISEKPLEKTLRKMFEISENIDTYWILSVDADVLVYFPGICKMVEFALQLQHDNLLEVYGLGYDKVLRTIRPIGPRLYNRKNMKNAKEFIPLDYKYSTPETQISVDAKDKLGFQSIKCIDSINCFHDFGQYYIDYFKKMFLYSNRYGYLIENIMLEWKKIKDDKDYIICLEGMKFAIENGKPFIWEVEDKKIIDKFNFVMNENNIVEKTDMDYKELEDIKVNMYKMFN